MSGQKLTKLRWHLSELFFRLGYRICPDKNAIEFVMRHGIDATHKTLAAKVRASLQETKR